MPVVNKDKYLSHIAGEIGRRAVYFEKEDRPEVSIGTRVYYMDSISFDSEQGRLTYTLTHPDGSPVSMPGGSAPLEHLTSPVLSQASKVVDRYAEMHRNRDRNITNIASLLMPDALQRQRDMKGLHF